MSLEAAIVEILQAESTVTDLIGVGVDCRLYPDLLPQNPTYPAVVYQTVDEQGVDSQQGATTLRSRRVQFWVLGTNKLTQVIPVAKAVENALRGYQGTVASVEIDGVIGEGGNLAQDEYDDTQQTHSRTFDLEFWHHG